MLILFYFIPGAQMANMFVYVHVNEVSTLQKTPFCALIAKMLFHRWLPSRGNINSIVLDLLGENILLQKHVCRI